MREPSTATMPDPMAKWTPVPDWSTATIGRADWSARPVLGLSLTLVAGNITAASVALAPSLSEIGLFQIADTPDYVIRIARDKALIVSSAPIPFEPGWNPAGFSATDASSAHCGIEISGSALPDIVAEATAADIDTGSRSASVLFAGIPCLVTRTAPDTARIFVEVGYLTYLWRWLEMR